MSRTTRVATTLAIALLVLTAGVASARTTRSTSTMPTTSTTTMRWGIQGWGGYNSMSMGDWNSTIDLANASGGNFDNINGGMTFGIEPTMTVNGTWQFGAHFERLSAHKSEYGGTTITNEANVLGVSATYLFPSRTKMAFGIGAALDHVSLAGNLSDGTTTQDTEGSGIGGQVMGTANYAFTPMFSGLVSAGYRIANINIDNIGGQDVSASGLKTEDYSGMELRVGLSLNQTPSHK